jgi:hypothetical protein
MTANFDIKRQSQRKQPVFGLWEGEEMTVVSKIVNVDHFDQGIPTRRQVERGATRVQKGKKHSEGVILICVDWERSYSKPNREK